MTQKHWSRQNLKTTYVIIWGQCSDPMRVFLEGIVGFEKYSEEKCPVATEGNNATDVLL